MNSRNTFRAVPPTMVMVVVSFLTEAVIWGGCSPCCVRRPVPTPSLAPPLLALHCGVPCPSVAMLFGGEIAVASWKIKEWQELSAKTIAKKNADIILEVNSAFMEHSPKKPPKHKHTILDRKSTVVVTNNKTRDAGNRSYLLIYIGCFFLNLCLVPPRTIKLEKKFFW